MRLPITHHRTDSGRRRRLPTTAAPAPLRPAAPPPEAQGVCETCKFLIEKVCLSARLGCFKDPLLKPFRIEPWTKLAHCPEQKW